MPDRLLPALVAAMTFLAALALSGAVGAALLAQRWSSGAASVLTVQVPDGDAAAPNGGGSRVSAVLAVLGHDPAIAGATRLDQARLERLLAPWLGGASNGQAGLEAGSATNAATVNAAGTPYSGNTAAANVPQGITRGDNQTDSQTGSPPVSTPALILPAVIQARLQPGIAAPNDLGRRLDAAAPGTLAERNQPWTDRLVALTTSLQACAGLALLVVTGVAVAVVAAATRAGLAARRHSIEIVHGLGAGDGYIAGRFARRTTSLAFSGGIVGTLLSIPLLLLLCRLCAPFATGSAVADNTAALAPTGSGGLVDWVSVAVARVPLPLWIALPLLPPIAASIGWTTAQATVRAWLQRLP